MNIQSQKNNDSQKIKNSEYFKNKIQLILYESRGIPKSYVLNKKNLKRIVYTAVSVILLSLGSLVFMIVGNRFKKMMMDKELVSQIEVLDKKVKKLESNNSSLLQENEKLASSKSLTENTPFNVTLISAPAGTQDQRNIQSIIVESFETTESNLSFKLKNNLSEGIKARGYLFLVFTQNATLTLWPQRSLKDNLLNSERSFNTGKLFGFERFTSINSSVPAGAKEVFILAYSRTGDLIHQEKRSLK